MKKMLLVTALVGAFLMAIGTGAFAQNLLTNPGFEAGLTGWYGFGNQYPEVANPPQFVPLSGNGLASMFGNWSGPYNVSGIFQEFPTTAGETWEMTSNARFWSGDPMIGPGAPNGNWVVQKLAWFDAGNNEIGGSELTILDGTYAADVWHASGLLSAVAPAGTVKVQALILYIQPAFDGGAAHIDDVYVANPTPIKVESSTWGAVKALYR
jgi:hypothetical protein